MEMQDGISSFGAGRGEGKGLRMRGRTEGSWRAISMPGTAHAMRTTEHRLGTSMCPTQTSVPRCLPATTAATEGQIPNLNTHSDYPNPAPAAAPCALR